MVRRGYGLRPQFTIFHAVLFYHEQFTHVNQKAQKYLLGGFEQLVGNVHKEALMPKAVHILKAFYDGDILDEEVIIDWDKKVRVPRFWADLSP